MVRSLAEVSSPTFFLPRSSVTLTWLWVEEGLGFPKAPPYRCYQPVWEDIPFLQLYSNPSALSLHHRTCSYPFPLPCHDGKAGHYSSTTHLEVLKSPSVTSVLDVVLKLCREGPSIFKLKKMPHSKNIDVSDYLTVSRKHIFEVMHDI